MLPADYITQFIILKDSIFNYNDSLFFNSIHPSQYGSINKAGNNSEGVRIYYTIRSGDSFSLITKRFKVTSEEIKLWNDIRKNRLIAGKKLTLYVSEDVANNYKNKKRTNVNNNVQTINNNVSTDDIKKGEYIYYTVKSGDNCYTISKKYTGVTADEIMKLNGITNSGSLQIGQKLKIKIKE